MSLLLMSPEDLIAAMTYYDPTRDRAELITALERDSRTARRPLSPAEQEIARRRPPTAPPPTEDAMVTVKEALLRLGIDWP